MKNLIQILIVLLMVGCANQTINYGQSSMDLELVMSKAEVLAILGQPRRTAVSEHGESWMYWNKTSYGIAVVDNEWLAADKLMVTFVDGGLVKWGQNFMMQDVIDAQKEMMESYQGSRFESGK